MAYVPAWVYGLFESRLSTALLQMAMCPTLLVLIPLIPGTVTNIFMSTRNEKFLFWSLVIGLILTFCFCMEPHFRNNTMEDIQNRVAEDAVRQYEIAERQGDKMQIYVQAGLVSAAYLQAQDEANYRRWKEVEREAGRRIGINR